MRRERVIYTALIAFFPRTHDTATRYGRGNEGFAIPPKEIKAT